MSRSLLVLGGVLLLLGLSGVFVPSEGVAQELSADGRFVVFDSESSRLVPGDTNGSEDVFVRDRSTGTTERVSVSGKEKQASAEPYGSYGGALSADGRYVAFTSEASNLVSGDTNGTGDIFVRDRTAGTTRRVSVSTEGVQANGDSFELSISADGRYVAFTSFASNLVPGDTNGGDDVFVHDRITGTTERVSVTDEEEQAKLGWGEGSYGPTLSADGRYVAFWSDAANLVPDDTNEWRDIFVRDRVDGETERVSLSADGDEATSWSESARISADGRFVAFETRASNLVPEDTNEANDLFLRDRDEDTTERISVSSEGTQGNADSAYWLGACLSADGRFVAFHSDASNLVSDDTNGASDVFLRDRDEGTTERVSVSTSGKQGYGGSYGQGLSADGRYVVFLSESVNLVEDGTDGSENVFIRDRLRGTTELVSVAIPASVGKTPPTAASDKATPQTLPYTGLPLLVIAALGVLLAFGGLVLRRVRRSG